MRLHLVLAFAATLFLYGCKGSTTPTQAPPAVEKADPPTTTPAAKKNDPAPPPVSERHPAVQALRSAIEKRNGYTEVRKEGRPILWAQFRSPGPSDDDLKSLRAAIAASPMPVGLNLNSCEKVTDAGLVHLKDLPSLVGLYLNSPKITDKGLENLAGMTNLENLGLSIEEITDAGLAPLSKLTKLRELSLYSKKVTEAGFVHLSGLTQMEKIDTRSELIGDTALGHMKCMTRLRELSACNLGSEDKLSDTGFAHIKNFTELRKLDFYGKQVTPAGLASLANLKKLEELHVGSCPAINGPGMAALKDLTNLRELELFYCGALTPEATMSLASLTKLKKIRFDGVQNDALKGIKDLTQLEDLQLFYTSVGDEGLAHLAGLKGLRSLDLSHTRVTDAGLKHLGSLTNLQELNLGDNSGITGPGLKELSGLANLKQLYLSDCKITDAGLKNLPPLDNLKDLSLGGNPITDAGVAPLKTLKNLKDLKLTGSKVTEDGAEALKTALPETRIVDASGSEVTLAKEKPRERPKVEDITKVAPAFSLTAKDFAEEYKKDRTAAAEKYKDKVIELTGVVEGFGRDISGGTHIHLAGPKPLDFVVCVTVDEEPWARVWPGQTIKVKGKWPESSFSPALLYCVVVDPGKYQPTVLTADQLAKEFGADAAATSKKYNDKYLILTGEIVSKEYNSVGASSILLKTEGKVKVMCSFTAFEKDLVKTLKAGQKVKVMGQYALNFGNEEVGLYFCLPFKKP